MKLSEFSKSAPPVSPGVSPSSPQEPGNASPEAPQEEQYFTSVTPSGIEVAYSPAPRRHYKLRNTFKAWNEKYEEKYPAAKIESPSEWQEVPSVTTVLGVLDRSGPLTWWGQGVGVDGVLELVKRGVVGYGAGILGGTALTTGGSAATKDEVVALLTEHKLSCNHVKNSAADRGVNVHGALEAWCEHRILANPDVFPENERGYIQGLRAFQEAVDARVNVAVETEVMVGSLEHSYAGRFDLVLTLSKAVEVVTKAYPKRPPKVEEIPAGRYLLDLKTRKKAQVYDSNFLQLEAYEAAAVECGYEPTDYRGVIVVTEDGKYQLSINRDWTFEDFLAVRACYGVMNERGVVQALRDELGATEVSNG